CLDEYFARTRTKVLCPSALLITRKTIPMKARRVLKPIVVATAVLIGVSPCAAGQDQSWVGEVNLCNKPRKEVRFQDRLEGAPMSLPFASHTPIKVRAEREGNFVIRTAEDRLQSAWGMPLCADSDGFS